MRKFLIVFALLCASGCGAIGREYRRGAPWSRANIAAEAAFVGALTVDCLQSVRITRGGREMNPIIGAHGDRVPLAVYCPTTALVHAALVHVMPASWRPWFQGFTVGVEGHVVITNWANGDRPWYL